MAKKDFQMRLGAPNIKGKQGGESKAASQGQDDTNNQQPKAAETTANRENDEITGVPEKIEKIDHSPRPEREETGRKLEKILTQTETKNPTLEENPFLQTKEHFDAAAVIKTGYKMRVEYKQTLKLLAEIKKGYTIEALLDDALTMYLQNTPEAQSAISMLRAMTR